MPFMKRRMEDDEEVPPEREARTKRMIEEVRDEPEYTDNEEDQHPAKKAPPKPSGLTIKMTAEEMKHDLAAHISVINATSDALLRTGMPAHLAQVTTQSICGAHIQRAKDIEAVLKQYA